MTTAINHFARAIRLNADSVKANNKTKADKLVVLVSDKDALKMLQDAQIDATLFATRALYATEKCVKSVYAVTRSDMSHDEISANAFVTLKTMLLCHAASQHITKRDIEVALSSDQKCDAARAALVYRRKSILSDATLSAQSQQCVDMLRTLKLTKEVSRNVFEIQKTVLFDQIKAKCENFAL